MMERDSCGKALVFSQFTSMLALIQHRLEQVCRGGEGRRGGGKGRAHKRLPALCLISSPPSPHLSKHLPPTHPPPLRWASKWCGWMAACRWTHATGSSISSPTTPRWEAGRLGRAGGMRTGRGGRSTISQAAAGATLSSPLQVCAFLVLLNLLPSDFSPDGGPGIPGVSPSPGNPVFSPYPSTPPPPPGACLPHVAQGRRGGAEPDHGKVGVESVDVGRFCPPSTLLSTSCRDSLNCHSDPRCAITHAWPQPWDADETPKPLKPRVLNPQTLKPMPYPLCPCIWPQPCDADGPLVEPGSGGAGEGGGETGGGSEKPPLPPG